MYWNSSLAALNYSVDKHLGCDVMLNIVFNGFNSVRSLSNIIVF